MSTLGRLVTLALICAAAIAATGLMRPVAAEPGCTKLSLPPGGKCPTLTVNGIAKDHVDFYRLDNTDTPDHTLTRAAICVPFNAANCGDGNKFLAIQADGGLFLFRRADVVVVDVSGPVCTCRSERVTVAGAPGAGVPECPKAQCP